jgi:MtrB/PioB family decaheme-associated outer membrane protein
MGRMSQDDDLLPYTVNPNLTGNSLPRGRLDGDVDTTVFSLRVTSQPLDKTRVRFNYRFNDRDNGTSVDAWNRVIVDAFVSGAAETNNPYSFQRSSISLAGDYDLFDTLQLSASIERKQLDRDLQEVAEQTEDISWGRVRWRPNGWLDVSAKAGNARRDIDRYDDTLAASFGQNPLLRKYNLAFRFREFAEINATAALPNTDITIGANVLYADDSYTRSVLGLLNSDDTRYGVDLAWQASDKTSVYAHSSWQDIDADQAGSEFFGQPDWRANTADSFQAYGVGITTQALSDRLDVSLDYTHSDGSSQITVLSAGGGNSRFPNIESDLDSLRLRANYRWSDRLNAVFELRYENFQIADWALQGVTPTAVPNLLALGAQPYDYDVLILGLGFRYGFGGGDLTLRSE